MDTWQTTDSMESYIKKMLSKRARLKTIFKFLRTGTQWSAIGDYPMIRKILLTVKEKRGLTKKEVLQLFKQSPEFKTLQSNHQNWVAFTHDLWEQKAPIKGNSGQSNRLAISTSLQARKDKND